MILVLVLAALWVIAGFALGLGYEAVLLPVLVAGVAALWLERRGGQ